MFRIGPVPGKPIPKGSIIICFYCEEIIGTTKRRIRTSRATWTSYYFIDYTIEPDWTDMCMSCGQLILGPASTTKYFSTESLLGRIVMFLAEKPVA